MLSKSRYISVKIRDSELKERNKELSLLLELGDCLGASVKIEDSFTPVLAKVLKYFKVEAGRIYLMDAEGQSLFLAAHVGLDVTGLEKIDINDGFSGKAARTGAFIAQYVSELEDEKRRAFLLSKGFKVIICVPLVSMNNVEGVLNMASKHNIELDREKIDLFAAIGNQIAGAAINAKLYENLRNKIKMLKEQKEMTKFIAYSVSHDLKSPATSMYGLAKRLHEKYDEALDIKGKEYCDQILKTAEIMVTLVEKINTYITAKEVPLRFEKVKFEEITQTVKNGFSTILEQRGIKWCEPEYLPEIVADKMALARVLQNLVENALKYGGKGLARIEIGYKNEEDFHVFSIQDDGIGIQPDDRERVFELFQRNETSKGKSGSGLGLAIVREIMAKHRGRAWVGNTPDRGAIFYLSISKDIDIDGT
jgi:K+-sensing histidine kinase KdpD